jgi:hypothetical protein
MDAVSKPKPVVLNAARGAVESVKTLVQTTSAAALKHVTKFADDTGLFRTAMDNLNGPDGMKIGRSFDTAEQSKAYFDERLQGAKKFLAERGLEGQVVAKLVSADMVTVAGQVAVEHAEWQFFLVPKSDAQKSKPDSTGLLFVGSQNRIELPGLLEEAAMTSWVKRETGQSQNHLLRSSENPLFLGRLNLGEGGMGIFPAVPEYAEVGGQRRDSRRLEGMVLVSPEQVKKTVDEVYLKLPGEWGDFGTCQQGAIATAESLGLDKVKVAHELKGLWITRAKYGRTGSYKGD